MAALTGFRWYSKYIAEIASDGHYPGPDPSPESSAPSLSQLSGDVSSRILLYNSASSGRVVVVDASVAPIFIVAVTLVTSIAVPLIFVRIARTAAVVWNWLQSRRGKEYAAREEEEALGGGKVPRVKAGEVEESGKLVPITHLPILLANSGAWLRDAWCSINLSAREFKRGRLGQALIYAAYLFLAIGAVVTGPIAAFMVSRDTVSGFSGALQGPCIHQQNFTADAFNANTAGADHHGRAMDLLPFLGNFRYSWSALGAEKYKTGEAVKDPISGVEYERINRCLLADSSLCDPRFPHTHKVTGELTPQQMGIWSAHDWAFRMEGYCLKLNSLAMRWLYASGDFDPTGRDNFYIYGLEYFPGAETDPPGQKDFLKQNPLGQLERQRYARRKNVITDAFFVNSEEEIGWGKMKIPGAIRGLGVDAFAVVTVLPTTTDAVNQDPGDELFLEPVATNAYNFSDTNIAHMLCWEKLSIGVRLRPGVKGARGDMSWAPWSNREEFVKSNGLDTGLIPLIQFSSTEFLLKPLRFLRGNTLLASLADTPRWEFNASLAAAVPFAAEMHRWGHIGLLDIASKAARTASGYYARSIPQNATTLEKLHTPEMRALCDSVRATREGAISLPLDTLIGLFLLLVIALAWWAVELGMTVLAGAGYSGWFGVLRPFLILPTTTPTALNASIAMAQEERYTVKGSTGGWPDVQLPKGGELGVRYVEREEGQVVLWGRGNELGTKRLKVL